MLLEDIEAGSIKSWLRIALEKIPDDSLKNLDWKPIVGQYAVRAKLLAINFMNDKTEISDRGQLEGLRDNMLKLAEETNVRQIPAYQPIQIPILAENLQKLSNAVEHLRDNDSATFGSTVGETGFNLQFRMAPERIEELLTQEVLESEEDMILKVKKPDYLGSSM